MVYVMFNKYRIKPFVRNSYMNNSSRKNNRHKSQIEQHLYIQRQVTREKVEKSTLGITFDLVNPRVMS